MTARQPPEWERCHSRQAFGLDDVCQTDSIRSRSKKEKRVSELNLAIESSDWQIGIVTRRRGDSAVLVELDNGDARWVKQDRPELARGEGHQVGLNDRRKLLAFRSDRGHLLPLIERGGLFSLLAGEGRIEIVGFSEMAADAVSVLCRMCLSDREGADLCEGHRRLGMGNIYRGSRYGRILRAFEAAAFREDWNQVAQRLEELAGLAFLDEARDLVDRHLPLKDRPSAAAARAALCFAFLRLSQRAGMETVAADLRAELNMLSETLGTVIEIPVDPINAIHTEGRAEE